MILERIDDWLINRVYQPIVDWSQRDGAWWMRETSMAVIVYDAVCLLSMLMGMGIDKRSPASPVIQMLIAFYFIHFARNKARAAGLGTNAIFRHIMIVILPIVAVMMVPFPFNYPVDLAFFSFYFFAACRPPKPREKKQQKLAFSS